MHQKLKTKKTIFSIFFICLLLSSVSATLMLQATASDPDYDGWLDGWQYRKSHTVNETPGADAGYQIALKVYYGSGTDGAETLSGLTFGKVYCDYCVQPDFDDVRFTLSDGETLLPYWIESIAEENYAIFWVKVTGNLTDSAQTLYIYYGNADASTTSDGTQVFELFDDFNDDSFNTNLWNESGVGTLTESNGDLEISSTNATYKCMGSYQKWGEEYAIRTNFKINYDGDGDSNRRWYYGWSDSSDGVLPGGRDVAVFCVDTSTRLYMTSADSVYTRSPRTNHLTAYTIGEICHNSTAVVFKENNVLTKTITTNTPVDAMGIKAPIQTNTLNIDWVCVRNWVSSEPVHDTWGPIETLYDAAYNAGYNQGWNDALAAVNNFTDSIKKPGE